MIGNPIEKVLQDTNLSMERLAEILGVSRQTVSNYKKNPSQMPIEQALKLSSATGIAIEKLFGGAEMKKGPQLKTMYDKSSDALKKAVSAARAKSRLLFSMKIEDKLTGAIKVRDDALKNLEDTINTARYQGRKPLACAFGPSDSGKSTLINYILGDTIVPASYSPMTTVPTYIMHKSEKPDYLKIEADNAIVFGRKKGDGRDPFNRDLFHTDKAKDYIIREGNYASILKEFGTREGVYYGDKEWEIDQIYVFVELDLLKEMTFVDIPGFGTGDKKDDVGLTMDVKGFDVIFFLSPVDAFMRENEIAALLSIIRNRETLKSLYVLGTHTNAVGHPDDVDRILERGCKRVTDNMADDEKARLGMTDTDLQALRNRFLGFDMTSDLYCNAINERLEAEIPEIIQERLRNAVSELKKACKESKKQYKKLLQDTENERRSSKSTLSQEEYEEAINKAVDESKTNLLQAKDRLTNSINEKEAFCCEKMSSEYDAVVNKDFIVSAIDRKSLKNKKADIETLANYLTETLNSKMIGLLENKSKVFADEVNRELEKYEKKVKQPVAGEKIHFNMNGFDFTRAFAAGLGGVAAYGALAAWAAIIAGGSNLGAYILVAKVVSWLGALGVSLGGAASVTSAVSAIGGPITLGIALAILAAIAIFGIFSGNWKSRVADKIIKTYNSNNLLGDYKNTINKYWSKDTMSALESCVDSLNAEVTEYYRTQLSVIIMPDPIQEKNNSALEQVYQTCVDAFDEMETELNREADEAA